MIEALLLRLDAPLMSFGGVLIDNLGCTAVFPGRAMLTGLLGNALGYRHVDSDRLQTLQNRLRYAVRCDRPGKEFVDYQTVDLSQPFLKIGWTSSGEPEGREGGRASEGTHIRYRHYIADAIYTLVLTVDPAGSEPRIQELEKALVAPARPLFIGRKAYLPSAAILLGVASGDSLIELLSGVPVPKRAVQPPWRAWWPDDGLSSIPGSRRLAVCDERDWANQIHTGRRWMIEGKIGG